MKTVLSVLLMLSVAVLMSGCDDGDDGGSSGGYGEFPEVSFLLDEDTDFVTCYNADSNVITTQQICTWNCAYYNNSASARKVTLWFDETVVEEVTGTETVTDPDTGVESEEFTYSYSYEVALVKEAFAACAL